MAVENLCFEVLEWGNLQLKLINAQFDFLKLFLT